MKQLTIEDAKQIELEILDYIDTLCKKHNINYIINYGTLIGAVRHQGFIPWDDDIDLSMPREDYQRFINIFQKEKSKYKLLSLETDRNYFNNFIKIIDSTTKIIDTCYKLESFKLLSFSKHKNIVYKDSLLKDWIRTAFWLLLRPVSPRYFANKIEKEIQKYSRKNGQYMAFIPSKFKEKEVFPSATFDKTIDLPFENLSLPAPEKYDTILTQFYGDYMTLPPEEKRFYSHEFHAYKLED